MNPLPRVAVIVPTHNRADMLRRCLTAIAAQPYANYEVFVVDDGSDETPQVVAEFGMHYVRHSGGNGAGPARNTGIRAAKNFDILVFTDDDCVVPSLWLPSIVEGFRTYPEVGAVGGPMLPRRAARNNLFAQHERFTTLRVGKMKRTPILGGWDSPIFGTNNIAYRCEAVWQAGGFDERFTSNMGGEDEDMKRRVIAHGWRFLYLPLPVAHWRNYTLRGFVGQHLARGNGATCVPVIRGGVPPTRMRVVLRIGIRTLRAVQRLAFGWNPKMVAACLAADLIDCVGQWRAITRLQEHPLSAEQMMWL